MSEFVGALRLRQLLVALVLVMTFEGLARKAAPPIFSIPIFFLKDLIVMAMAFYIVRLQSVPSISFLITAYKILAVLFVPLFLVTAWHDPLLAVFGLKEYLLYPVVGLAVFQAFQHENIKAIEVFFRRISLLLIPTAFLAFVELHLPTDHWLNRSVSGESLEIFIRGGEMRVSSTFSFVAQYCAYLNAQVFIVMIALQDWRNRTMIWKMLLLLLFPLLIYSSYITGSRGAVVGNLSIILLAALLVLMKFQVRNFLRMVGVMVSLYLIVLLVNHFAPDSTAAYSERENGQLIGFSDEIRARVWSAVLFLSRDKVLNTFFGNGIGIMSNGSDSLSSYAAYWRDYAYAWTETDFSSTLFEGGYYMALVWYGFRFYIIAVTTFRFLSGITAEYTIPVAFVQAFVIIIGFLGTLGIQPPVAIWWWLGVGTSLLFWWKSIIPPEPEIKLEELPPPPKKLARGRSLYSDVLHPPKK